MLVGRERERAVLAGVLAAARGGRSALSHLVGEPGVGKSALLADAIAGAADFLVCQATAVEVESTYPFAALSALLRPLLPRTDLLRGEQRRAVRAALLLDPPDHTGDLSVRGGVLQLLALAAEDKPLLLVADDVHWFDADSWSVLKFSLRRLAGEGVGVLLASRPDAARTVPGTPPIWLEGLDDVAAAALLDETAGDLARDVRSAVVARTQGNPLAMVEAVRSLSASQRRGLQDLPDTLPLGDALQREYAARIQSMPHAARQVLLLVALNGAVDPATLTRAGQQLGVDAQAWGEQSADYLSSADGIVTVRHPMLATAAMQACSAAEVRVAHGALATALAAHHPDRAIWHQAAACQGPDASIADALAEVARRAAVRGTPAAASSSAERAAWLSPDPVVAATLLAEAGELALSAGNIDRADLLAERLSATVSLPALRARSDLVRGRVAMLRGLPQLASRLLLGAAPGLPPGLALVALDEAIDAAEASGDLGATREAAQQLEGLSLVHRDLAGVRLLILRARSGLVGAHDGQGELRRELATYLAIVDADDAGDVAPQTWVTVATAACSIGDLDDARIAFTRGEAGARRVADLPRLAATLAGLAFVDHAQGSWESAYVNGSQCLDLLEPTAAPVPVADVHQILADIDAARGDEATIAGRLDIIRTVARNQGLRRLALLADRRQGLLELSLGRLDDSIHTLEAVRRAAQQSNERHPFFSPIPDLVEARVRANKTIGAAELLAEFAALIDATSPAPARARLLRTQALLAPDERYDELFQESLRVDAGTGMRFHRARTQLCYGERLRRDRRRVDARLQLGEALEVFRDLGAAPWAGRATVELEATGGRRSGTRPDATVRHLTPQERQVAALVSRGLRNRDIAATLFMSVRTVEFHLTSTYRKFGVSSRIQLARALHEDTETPLT
jgi:DNA-binding CsgD family transcriptional regulator/tetratricopeptide (TPR) repeat protein